MIPLQTLILLVALSPAGDFLSTYFAGDDLAIARRDCEVVRESFRRALPYVSPCLPVDLERTEWQPPRTSTPVAP